MKRSNKDIGILKDNSGESMVEVLVAFTLLSIMLVLFAQGITWASKAEMNATNSRNAADKAMLEFQQTFDPNATDQIPGVFEDKLKRGEWTYTGEDGRIYSYVYYVAVNTNGG
ncbi:MAG: hypothetical protein K6A37_02810 [Saccharofermentans sp.]|nr:hypothetical protein [Saccharofermentans sp.]